MSDRRDDFRYLNIRRRLTELGYFNGKMLDVGCGDGWMAALFEEDGFAVTGIDKDPTKTKAACRRGIPSVCMDADGAIAYNDEQFDVIIACEVLEHIRDLEHTLDELRRILRPGGVIIIFDKNADHWGCMETEPGERWFHPGDIRFPDDWQVKVRTADTDGQAKAGLFLYWIAQKPCL